MLISTDGIVLHTIKYSETSIIAHIFTKDFGIGSYIMNGVRSKRSKMAYFQPFSHITFEAFKKENNTIHRIKEVRFKTVKINIHSDFIKQSISQFLGEVLYKLIHKEDSSPELFSFFVDEISYLENEQNEVGNFHIYFLIKLMSFFGIEPHNNFSGTNSIFNIEMGEFTNLSTESCLSKEVSFTFHSILNDMQQNTKIASISKSDRSSLLTAILQYYRIHMHEFGKINSLDVFKSVFE